MENKKYCQSCGMPLDGEHNEYSQKEASGIESDYCTMCYSNGKFLNPDIKLEEMIELGVGFLKKNIGEDAARKQLESFLPYLKRWR
jgi:hypothetical protein